MLFFYFIPGWTRHVFIYFPLRMVNLFNTEAKKINFLYLFVLKRIFRIPLINFLPLLIFTIVTDLLLNRVTKLV